MKKMCSNLWRVLGKAVLACALVTPVLVTSCDKFDDSELKQDISNINEELSKINERIDKLETELSEQVNSLTALINGKVSVVSCTKDAETGVTTVVLSDGSQFIVYPQSESPDFSGITFLTTIEENGVLYWATSTVGGTPEALLVDGKKVPVSVQPDLKIENGKWYISVDGGKTWIETGIEEEKAEEVVVFFSNVREDEDYVYLTLKSGTEIKVAKDKEAYFAVSSQTVNLTYGNPSSYVQVSMVGVVDYTITEKPEGWKASIESVYGQDVLVVTAPKEGAGEKEGYIKILATFETANPVIAKVYVTVEPDFVLKRKNDNVLITLAEVNVGNWDYSGYVYAAMPLESFTDAAAVDYLNANMLHLEQNYDSLVLDIKDIIGDSYDKNASYVVFAANWKSPYMDESYTKEDVKYITFEPQFIKAEIVSKLDDANVTLSFSGYEGYYAGCETVDNYDPAYMLSSIGYGYMPSELGTEAYDGSVGLICGGWNTTLSIGTDYIFWVLPYNSDGEYDEDSFQTWEFSTLSVTSGGSFAAPAVTITSTDFTSVKATVTAVDGAYKTYACTYLKSALPETDDELIEGFFNNYPQSATTGEINIQKSYLNPGTEVVVVAFAVDEDGKHGAIAKIESASKAIVFNDALTVAAEALNVGVSSADVKLTFTGTAATIKYWCQAYELADAENSLITSNYTGTKLEVSALTDNTILLTNLVLGRTYYFYVVAFDADGNPSHMASTTFTPSSDIVYIKKSAENWAYGQPTIDSTTEVWGEDPWIYNNYRGGWFASSCTYTVKMTLGENCKKAFVLFSDPETQASRTELTLSDWVVSNGTEYTASATIGYDYVNPDSHIYIVWVDSDDKYHTYYDYTIVYPEKPTEAPSN